MVDKATPGKVRRRLLSQCISFSHLFISHSTLATADSAQRMLSESPVRETCDRGKCFEQPGASRFKN